MNDAEQKLMEEAEILARIAGLRMDQHRLEEFAAALGGVAPMIETMVQVESVPIELALEPYDPAWPETASR